MQFAELPLVASPISVVDQQVIEEGIQQCATDLQLSDITLIRQSMNAVYQATSANGPLIMRVSRPTTSTQPAIEFADYLLSVAASNRVDHQRYRLLVRPVKMAVSDP